MIQQANIESIKNASLLVIEGLQILRFAINGNFMKKDYPFSLGYAVYSTPFERTVCEVTSNRGRIPQYISFWNSHILSQ